MWSYSTDGVAVVMNKLFGMKHYYKSGRTGPGWGIESRKRWRKVGVVSGEESDRWVPCRRFDLTRTDGRAGEGRSAPSCQSWVPQKRRASFAVNEVEDSYQPLFFAGIQDCDLDGGRQEGVEGQLMFPMVKRLSKLVKLDMCQ